MSASKMRTVHLVVTLTRLVKDYPEGLEMKKLYLDVRKYMGIRERRDMGEMTDFESLRDMYLTGKIWNIDDLIEGKWCRG